MSLTLRPFHRDDVDDYCKMRVRVHHNTASDDEKKIFLNSLVYLYQNISARSIGIQDTIIDVYNPVVRKYCDSRERIQELLPKPEVEAYMNYNFTLQKLEFDMGKFDVSYVKVNFEQVKDWLDQVNQMPFTGGIVGENETEADQADDDEEDDHRPLMSRSLPTLNKRSDGGKKSEECLIS